MKYDLKGMNPKELKALQRKIDTALGRVTAKDKKAALAAAEKAAKAHGFTLAELVCDSSAAPAAKAKPNTKKQPAPAKFANPSNKSQTWSGKGRQPGWFKEAVGSGRSPTELEI